MIAPTPTVDLPPFRSARRRASFARAALAYVLLIALARGALFFVAAWLTDRASPSSGCPSGACNVPGSVYLADLLVVVDVLTIALVALALLSWLLWVAWTSRLEENVRALGAGEGATGPRGTVVWWLVPLANLLVPFGVIASIDRRLTRGERPHDLLIATWWVLFIGSVTAVVATSALLALPASSSRVRADEFLAIGVSSLIAMVASFAAIRVVRTVQRDEDFLAGAVLPGEDFIAGAVLPDESAEPLLLPAGEYPPADGEEGLAIAAAVYEPRGTLAVYPATVPPPWATPAPPGGPYLPGSPVPGGPSSAGPLPGGPIASPPLPGATSPATAVSATPAAAYVPPALSQAAVPPTGSYFVPDGSSATYPPPPPPAFPAASGFPAIPWGPPPVPPAPRPMPAPAPSHRRRDISWMIAAAVAALAIALVAAALIPLDDLGTPPTTTTAQPTAAAIASSTPRATTSATHGPVASPSSSAVASPSSRPSASPMSSNAASRSPSPSGSGPLSTASPSDFASGSPGVNPSPSSKPSPSPSLGPAPAGIQLLLQHRTAGDGPCVAAPFVSQPAGATAAIVCQPPGSDVSTLMYAVYPTPDEAQQVVETARTNAGIPTDSGDCFNGTAGENAYKTNGSPRGRVLCYTSGTGTTKLAHVIWYDRTLSVVGQATAPATAFKALCDWWATQSGPA